MGHVLTRRATDIKGGQSGENGWEEEALTQHGKPTSQTTGCPHFTNDVPWWQVRMSVQQPGAPGSLLICKKSHIIHQKEVSSEDKALCGAAGRIQSQRLGTDVVGGPGLLVQKMCSPCKLTCGSWSSQASACCLDRRPPGTLSHTPLPLARERKPAPTPRAPRPPAPAPWATQLCPRHHGEGPWVHSLPPLASGNKESCEP